MMKRKLLSILLALCMVASLLPAVSITAGAEAWDGTASYAWYTGGPEADGFYHISSAAQLAGLAHLVNFTDTGASGQDAAVSFIGETIVLDSSIDLNGGVSFTFDADTGLVAVTNGTNTFYLGTGLPGDSSADNSAFDETASTVGAVYSSKDATAAGTDTIGLHPWTPVGDITNSFAGTFDGGGNEISGLYLNTTGSYQGLFGYGKGSVISHVGVVNSYINCGSYSGSVAGYIDAASTVTNCYHTGSIAGKAITYGSGGVVGYTRGLVTNCYNTGNISWSYTVAGSDFHAYIGGVTGYNQGTLTNCHNIGNITGKVDGVDGGGDYHAAVGGVSGTGNGNMKDCWNAGSITGSGISYAVVGGVAGLAKGLVNCYNTGSVTGESTGTGSSDYIVVGGLLGLNSNGEATNCYNTGSVIGRAKGYAYVGGISGQNNYCEIRNCYNTGSITGTASAAYIGGIAAQANGTPLTNCYNTGSESATGTGAYVGGVVGYYQYTTSSVSVADCYWLLSAEQTVKSSVRNQEDRVAVGRYRYNSTYYMPSDADYATNLVSAGVIDCASFSGSGTDWTLSNSSYFVTPASGGDAVSLPENTSLLDALNAWVDTTDYFTWKSDEDSSMLNGGFPLLDAVYTPITGTPTIAVTNGYGESSDQIKIGATLTATANTTPSTNLSYQWQVSADGSADWSNAAGTGNSSSEYTVSSADATKYLRVKVTSGDAPGEAYSSASAQVPYTITISQSGASGTDVVSFSSAASALTTYAASGSVPIYYTLDDSGTGSNTLTYSGGSITKVTSAGTGNSSYTVDCEDAASGSIAITAAFSHVNLISGTPTIAVTNGYGESSDQIKIGATLIATANTTPSTNLSYQWQVSSSGSDNWTSAAGTGNSSSEYTVSSADATKYLRVKVTSGDAPGEVYSSASAQVPYTITLSQSGASGTDAVSFSSAASVRTTYAASGSVAIYYTLDDSGTGSNTLTYSGGSITKVTSAGTGNSSYTVNCEDAASGSIAITAAFSHVNLISGTPTIAVTNGYGESSDQIKIGATLTATANTTPSTNLSYQWQISADGLTDWSNAAGTGYDSSEYTVGSADAAKYLRVKVTSGDAPGEAYSSASAQVPYTITLSQSGASGTDAVSFSSAASVRTTYAASGSVAIYYTLDASGTKSNTLTYSGGSITKVASAGTGNSSYTVNCEDASNGVIAVAAAFAHTNYGDISGIPTITVTNGFGDGSDHIKIGATLTAAPNTIPDTHLSYQWEVSEDGSDGWANAAGTGNDTASYIVGSSDAAKYLRVKVTSSIATSAACSAVSAQVPYTITISPSGNTGTDAISFQDASSVATTYAAGGSVTIYYTLGSSGTRSNTLSYSGAAITQVSVPGTGGSTYLVSGEDATDGVIAIAAAFVHRNSSGGSSSNSVQTTPASGAPVVINGRSQTAGTSATTKENGKTKTTVTVDTDKLEKILNSEGDGATVTIPVPDDTDAAAGVLTGKMVKNMEQTDAILEVQTGSAAYTLPAAEIDIDAVSEQFGENIDLSQIEVEIAIAEPTHDMVEIVENAAGDGGFSVMVPPVAFTVTCTYSAQAVEVENYTAYVKRTIEIPGGVDPNRVTTAVVVQTDGTVRHVPTEVVEMDGVYYAVINSLTNSVYTLIHNEVQFADLEGHWAQDAVNDLASRKILAGYDDGAFRPDGDITRAEFTAIVVRALGLPEGTGENQFTDVSSENWYCGYVETASAYGIIAGYANGTYGPNDKITREQAMTMIARAMELARLDAALSDPDIAALLGHYTDAAGVSEYARRSAAACIETGIVSGKGNETLAPKDNMTRAEVAAIVQRLLQKSELI